MKEKKDYTYRSMRREREYGLYWYSGLWQVMRPILIAVTVAVIVGGVCLAGWNKLYQSFIAPVNPEDTETVTFEITSGQSLSRVASNLEQADLVRNRLAQRGDESVRADEHERRRKAHAKRVLERRRHRERGAEPQHEAKRRVVLENPGPECKPCFHGA